MPKNPRSSNVTGSHLDSYPRMTVMDHNSVTPLVIILLTIFGIVSMTTLLGNGFIIVVNSHRWLQRRKLVPCDLLLTCLSITRFLLQCVTFLSQCMYISSPVVYICSFRSNGGGLFWIYFNMANFSGTTCLIVFYCVKVTNFAHPLFFWLKLRIDRFVPQMLVISFIAIILFSLPGVWYFWRINPSCLPIRNPTVNTSHAEASGYDPNVIISPLQFTFSIINFGICLTVSILLLVSLWRHTRSLKKSGINTQDLSTLAHIKVIKQLMFFLFFYILYFASNIIISGDFSKYGRTERLITDIVLSLYPSAHSIILIWTNPKLKSICTHILPSRE